MSLLSSIRMANNTLQANQIAMQVIGQNIANANTPGYIREETNLTPAGTERRGGLILGLGVKVSGVVQKLDTFLEERLRGAVSERAGSETQENVYIQLEGLIGEMSDTDLSTALTEFFASVSEVLNQPESVSVRNLAVLQGVTLASEINRLAERVSQLQFDLNQRVQDVGGRINKLTEEIRKLNVQISEAEGGGLSNSDAVGLRDRRLVALEELAELVNIRVKEQPNGSVTVYAGGDFLVYEGTSRQVEVVIESDEGTPRAEIHLVDSQSPLEVSAGELDGLTVARDDVLGGFLDTLDELAGALAFEFNKIHSGGQGLTGYQELTGQFAVADADAALNAAGLAFTPKNGSFQVLVRNRQTGLVTTHDVTVDLNGVGDDMTLADLAAALDAIDGVSAAITPRGELTMAAETSDAEFAFAGDTSGVLAALGVNTFFTGSGARNLGVSDVLRQDPAKLAASGGGIAADTAVAVQLAGFLDRPLDSQDGKSLAVLYDRMMGDTAQASTVTRSVAEGTRVFEDTLRGQKLATSGVSLDEEAVKLMAFQRSFQASARFIGVIDELLGILVNL